MTIVGSSDGETFVELNRPLKKAQLTEAVNKYLDGSLVVLHGIPFDFMM
jgi:hypothetical protein